MHLDGVQLTTCVWISLRLTSVSLESQTAHSFINLCYQTCAGFHSRRQDEKTKLFRELSGQRRLRPAEKVQEKTCVGALSPKQPPHPTFMRYLSGRSSVYTTKDMRSNASQTTSSSGWSECVLKASWWWLTLVFNTVHF